ncbi:MAG TPA: hypothetical protein VGC77_07220 [Rhodopseudomonas sp.]|uniref:hypothetical protein n=1 Tax=Rhodopseudomonas sp. TaxID=1078 RepID=UPI002ED8AE69
MAQPRQPEHDPYPGSEEVPHQRAENDPYLHAENPRSETAPYQPSDNDPYQRDPADAERALRLDQELQADAALGSSRMSGGRIAAFAAAVVILIGALYYGMNVSSTNTAANRDAGTTTGSAPAAPPANGTSNPSR